MSRRLGLFRRLLMQTTQGREAHAPHSEARTQSIPRKEAMRAAAMRVVRQDKFAMKDEKLQRLMARA